MAPSAPSFTYNDVSGAGTKGYVTQKGPRTGTGIGDIFKNINPSTVSNLVGYLSTLRANRLATQGHKRAALAGIVRSPMLNREYFRATSPYAAFYNKQADRLNTKAKRIAAGTSDFDKSAAIQLEGVAKGADVREKGMQLDQQHIQSILDRQTQSDRQTDTFNLKQAERSATSTAQAEKAIHLADSNRYVANNAALNNLLLAENNNRIIRQRKKRYEDLYKVMTDPKQTGDIRDYRTYLQSKVDAEKAWKEGMISKDPSYNFEANP